MRRSAALLSVLVVWGVACGESLPVGVARFDGTDVTLPTGDLAPLWRLVGDARIIGLGESIHTSGGFLATKQRVIRALIEERGVRALAMESPRDRARKLDGYLVSGACDRPAEDVLSEDLFEVFSDDHTYALMRWICERNAAAPGDPVRLFGFDIQQPDQDFEELRALLASAAPADAPALLAGIAGCATDYSIPLLAPAYASCLQGLDVLDAWVPAHEAALVLAAGERTVRLFDIARVSFRAAQDQYFLQPTDFAASYQPRDLGMGAVFQAVLALDFPADVRVAVWAHNVHLAMHHDQVVDSPYAPGAITFGTVVARAFGADYAAVALTGFAPGTNWPQIDLVTDHTTYGTERGSVEVRLHNLGEPYLIVDPRAKLIGPDEQPLNEETVVPADQFTAIVYLDSSPPMDAVFW